MVDKAEDLKPEWLAAARTVGVTAGASAPEILVEEVTSRLRELGAGSVEQLTGVEEHTIFPLPRGLAA